MDDGQKSVWKPHTINQLPAPSFLIVHFTTSFTPQLFNPEATGIVQPHRGCFLFTSVAWIVQSTGEKIT